MSGAAEEGERTLEGFDDFDILDRVSRAKPCEEMGDGKGERERRNPNGYKTKHTM